MTTNERTSDDVPPPASTKPAAQPAPDSRPSDVPASASSGVAPLSGRGATGTKKKKKKKKANGATATPAPAAVAASVATPAPAPTSTKSVPPASAANTNGTAAKSGREDDESVPPAADLDHHFFESQSAIRAHDSLHPLSHADETKAPDPRLAALMREETLRRRAQFTKYVKAVFAGSIIVCLAAVISVSVRRNHPDQTIAAAATTPMRPMRQAPPPPPPSTDDTAAPAATTAPLAPAAETIASADPAPSATADAPASATAAATDTAPTPAPSASAAAPVAPSATVAAADPSSDAPAELDPKAALKEKRQAQRGLDNGKIADAIEHGEASVKLDPTDAEAWLILGAAYQMKGDLANAKRSFGSCLKEGKRGPRGECAAMPH